MILFVCKCTVHTNKQLYLTQKCNSLKQRLPETGSDVQCRALVKLMKFIISTKDFWRCHWVSPISLIFDVNIEILGMYKVLFFILSCSIYKTSHIIALHTRKYLSMEVVYNFHAFPLCTSFSNHETSSFQYVLGNTK